VSAEVGALRLGLGDGEGFGVGVISGMVTVGVGGDVGVGTGVAVGLAVGLGVGDGQPEALPSARSPAEQSGSEPATALNALGFERLLTKGTEMAPPAAVPNTWFMGSSTGAPLVWPTHADTTQSGV
jgi:hypothetical protein